jgi:hypothetical protein
MEANQDDVGTDRRNFIKRTAITAGFVAPVIASFDLAELTQSANADPFASNQIS